MFLIFLYRFNSFYFIFDHFNSSTVSCRGDFFDSSFSCNTYTSFDFSLISTRKNVFKNTDWSVIVVLHIHIYIFIHIYTHTHTHTYHTPILYLYTSWITIYFNIFSFHLNLNLCFNKLCFCLFSLSL